MTTTTDPDVQVTNADTGEVYPSQIRDEAARLDGAATDGLPVPWVAKTPANITPAPTCATCGGSESGRKPRSPDSELPARTWARLSGARQWPQIPHDALTAHGRMEAEFDSAHQQIQDLRDMAFWAEQEQRKAWSAISDDYRAKREALLTAYERECEAIKAGLRARPEYGGHVYDEDEGFKTVDADRPPDDRIDRMIEDPDTYFAEARERARREVRGELPPQGLTPAERAIVEEATQRRKKLAQAAQGERTELPAPEHDGTVRESRWARLAAWFGGATTRRRQTEQDGVE